jgi:hypothetical protein
VLFLYDVSPDGKMVSAWDAEQGTVALFSTDTGARQIVCTSCAGAGAEERGLQPPRVGWSRDGHFLYFHTKSSTTYFVPLASGELVPALPEAGYRSIDEAVKALGGRAIPEPRAFPSADPSVYPIPRSAAQRNNYRVPVP